MLIKINHGNESTITTLTDGVPDLSRFSGQSLAIRLAAFEAGDWVEIVPSPIQLEVREIDARRLRLSLLQLGLLDEVESALSSLGRRAQIEWEYATTIREDNPLVVAIKEQLNLDTDAIITLALSLT